MVGTSQQVGGSPGPALLTTIAAVSTAGYLTNGADPTEAPSTGTTPHFSSAPSWSVPGAAGTALLVRARS